MIALLSILLLLTLLLLLAAAEHFPWPLQRTAAIHDTEYWRTVQRDTAAYLATHSGVSSEIRRNVEGLGRAATQRLGGLSR